MLETTSRGWSKARHYWLIGLSSTALGIALVLILSGRFGGRARSCTDAQCQGATSLAGVYKSAKWGPNVSISFLDRCTMTLVSDGLPNHALPPKYLFPLRGAGKGVAHLPVSGGQLIVEDRPTNSVATIATFNVCPTRAPKTTQTNLGMIGMIISGSPLFNGAEGNGNPALSDNASFTYTDAAGRSQVASFLNVCNGHFNPDGPMGPDYHYHAVSPCVTAKVDTKDGPSHLIGIALDGYPIYGGRDMNARIVKLEQLDACNGISSPTPEFPQGIYHYVLPEGVTDLRSSLPCYSGHVTRGQLATAEASGICTGGSNRRAAPLTLDDKRLKTASASGRQDD